MQAQGPYELPLTLISSGAVEGAWAVAGNPLVSLSEEELVQCDTGQKIIPFAFRMFHFVIISDYHVCREQAVIRAAMEV
jgi:hypothetical protein